MELRERKYMHVYLHWETAVWYEEVRYKRWVIGYVMGGESNEGEVRGGRRKYKRKIDLRERRKLMRKR